MAVNGFDGGRFRITIVTMKKPLLLWFVFLPFLLGWQTGGTLQVEPGDTWPALAARYGTTIEALQAASRQINRQRQPVIGSTMAIPAGAEQHGTLIRPYGSLLVPAMRHQTSPWLLALQNGRSSPYRPGFYRPLFVPGGEQPPRDLPAGLETLELSQLVAHPGQAVAIRGRLQREVDLAARLAGEEMAVFRNGRSLLALTGTGAFFGSGQPDLTIQMAGQPLWSQPWQFIDPDLWQYQEITLTGEAAQIDQASIEAERARLFAIWEQATPQAQWSIPFQLPLTDYLAFTSLYGARRSYNGGPYRTYHEGVDFSAYGGTAVFAPAAGTVVLAERLYVRGGAVIIDHGLSIYTGFYHLSEVTVAPGDMVAPGQMIGAVGTTGLSTGNHLHWDLLVNGVWVDAQAWLEQDMACWILAGMGTSCPGVTP